jgi:hypothetical protein
MRNAIARTFCCGLFPFVAACSSEVASRSGSETSGAGQGAPQDTTAANSGAGVDTQAPRPGPAVDAESPSIGPVSDGAPDQAAEAAFDGGNDLPGGEGGVEASPPSPTGGLTSKDFVCSWVLGIHTTAEWFMAGFENVVDPARWQVSGIEMAQFDWAKPDSPLWNSPITSPCATNSKTPDRIVFTGVDGTSTTAAQFLPQYVSVVNIIKMRFPSVERIDLMTTARAPGDIECVNAQRPASSYIQPGQDEAIAMTVAMFPGFVFATPKWEVASCSDFTLCPHITAAANAILAKTIGEYFLAN